MDAESETLVTHTLTKEGFDASEDGTGRGTPIIPIAFSSKDHGADAGSISPTVRSCGFKDSHANAGGPPAVTCHQGVRRLLPVETERLQGFTSEMESVFISLCQDASTNSARVEISCARNPIGARNAGEGGNLESALSAYLHSPRGQGRQESAVAAFVRINQGPELLAIHSQKKCIWSVNGVAGKNSYPLPMPPEDFAHAIVALKRAADHLAGPGKVGSPQNMICFTIPESGSIFAQRFGGGIAVGAEDAKKEVLKFITSNLGAHIHPSGLTPKTWLSFACCVIGSFIREPITQKSFARLEIHIETGWTSGFADGPRYGMNGNAVAVPCAEWIGKSIVRLWRRPTP